MVNSRAFTLIGDGASDKILVRLLSWVLEQHSAVPYRANWIDPREHMLPRDLRDRISRSLELFPCDLLFVHRDSEKEVPQKRHDEISHAALGSTVPVIGVVPVRMTEAWFLFDQDAIRSAAGRPQGRFHLNLPQLKSAERLPDPKKTLDNAIIAASGRRGRRLKTLDVRSAKYRIAERISTFAPLRAVASFARLETDVQLFLQRACPSELLSE